MQTAYNIDPARGVVGAISRAGAKTIRAKASDGIVRPGQYVILAGDLCKHPIAAPTAANRGGVVVRNPYKQANGVYADGEMVDILVFGSIWVASQQLTVVDTGAFVRFAGAGDFGAFRNDADTANATSMPGYFFRSVGTTLVELEVNHL